MRRARSSSPRAVFTVFLLGAMAACTVFNGLSVPTDTEKAGAEAGAGDGSIEGGARDSSVSLPAPGFVAHDEAIAACSVIAACPHLSQGITRSLRVAVDETVLPPGPMLERWNPSFSFCVEQLSKTFDPARPGQDIVGPAVRKIAQAVSCAEARKAVLFELVPGLDARCDGGPPSKCLDDETALQCDFDEGYSLVTHCNAPYGAPSDKCKDIDAGGVGVGGCFLEDGLCPTCEGSFATFCGLDVQRQRQPYRFRTDCNALGLECTIVPGSTELGCAMSDHIVRRDSYFYPGSYCDGPRVMLSDGTFSGFVDCSSFGGNCVESSGAATCTLPGAECHPFSPGANRCNGSKLHLCVGGHWEDVTCANGCDTADAAPGRASCRPPFNPD
ncbi:hypothetical protein [Labilithrix luteola]|uniref:hypothetical protein n=1 Tax=Labilithrix luteola TaxID=1391654 RepID=UPI0011BAD44F|nr:hypothetical protein [Labilithrix luteola]